MSKFDKYNEIIQLQVERRPETRDVNLSHGNFTLEKEKPFEISACLNDAFNNSSINVRYYSY